MKWFWYVARPNELFMDIDNFPNCEKHIRERLQGAIECGKIQVDELHLFHSTTKGHVHGILVLDSIMTPFERYAWEVIFHGDIYRACANIMREIHSTGSPDILISKRELHRAPDNVCNCEEKHKKIAVMENCQAARALRGIHRTAQFFGKPSRNVCAIWPEIK